MAKKNTTEETLANFDWEDTEDTFFGVKVDGEEEDEVQKVVEKVIEDDDTKKKPAAATPADDTKKPPEKEDDDEEEEEVSFFEKTDDEGGEGGKGNEDESELTEEQFAAIASYQVSKLKYAQVKEGEEITPERLDELLEEEKKLYARDELDKISALGGDLFKRQIEYMNNGGSAEDFISQYREVEAIPDFNAEDENQYDEIIRFYLKNIEEKDDDEVTEFFNFLDESGKKEVNAKKYAKRIATLKKERDKEIEEDQRNRKRLQDENKAKFVEEFQAVLDDEESVGFAIPKEIAAQLPEFFSEPTEKTGKGTYSTKFQSMLTKLLFEDKANLAKLGYLMLSNWDMSVFEKKAASEATRKIKKNLSTTVKKPASQSTTRKRSLTEFFSE